MVDFTFLTYAGSSIIALFVGFLTGIFGAGGGFIMAPALMILLGVPGNIAVGTGLASVFVNSSFGMFKRRGSETIDVKLAVTTACGSILGVLVGLAIMEMLKKAPALVILGREQQTVQYVLLCLYLPMLLFIVGVLVFDLRRNSSKKLDKRVGLFSRIKVPPYMHFGSLESSKLSVLPIMILGFLVGILTALMGVGGGIIMLPALVYLVGQRTAKAAGTSLLLVWISSAISVTGHISAGNVKFALLVGMLVGGIIGTNFGTYLGLKLPGRKIRSYFVYVVLLAILMVAFKVFKLTFG